MRQNRPKTTPKDQRRCHTLLWSMPTGTNTLALAMPKSAQVVQFWTWGTRVGAFPGRCGAILGRFANPGPVQAAVRPKTMPWRDLGLCGPNCNPKRGSSKFSVLSSTQNGPNTHLVELSFSRQPPLWPRSGLSWTWVPGGRGQRGGVDFCTK